MEEFKEDGNHHPFETIDFGHHDEDDHSNNIFLDHHSNNEHSHIGLEDGTDDDYK